MHVVVSVDGDDDVVAWLESWIRDTPALADVQVSRGRGAVRPDELGAVEVLAFVATDVTLPLILNVVYEFFKSRRRSRPTERAKVVLTRTDLPDGSRQVRWEVDGPADTVGDVVRRLRGDSDSGDG